MTGARTLHPPFRRVPWKNGLGSTLELATDASEPGGPWTWRLSVADVPARGAFSRFDGVERHLAVLEGAGMRLWPAGAAEPRDVPVEGAALRFEGEEALEGEPLGAGVRDLNLMCARSQWRGALRVMRGRSPALSLRADVSLAYLHAAPAPIDIEADGERLALAPGSLVVASWIALPALDAGTVLAAARIVRARHALA